MSELAPSPGPRLTTRVLKIVLPVLILVLASAGFALLKATRAVTSPVIPQERSWRVSTVTVNPGRYTPNVLLYGIVEAPNTAALKAAITADITQVSVKEGQTVAAGDLLVKLDDRDIALGLRQREADLRETKAQIRSEQIRHAANRAALKRELNLLALARRTLTRNQNLNRKQLASEFALDTARQAVEKQALAVETRQVEVDNHPARLAQLKAHQTRVEALRDQARLDQSRTQINAPFSGRITTVAVTVGDRVRTGDLLLRMYPLVGLEVRAQIPFHYLAAVRRALAAKQQLAAFATLDGQTVPMMLDRLGGETGERSGGLDALFYIRDNAAMPAPGRVLSLVLDLPPVDEVVALPFEALYGLNRIYRLDNDRMKALTVQRIGERREANGTHQVLIRSPDLRAGDRIISTQLPNAITGLKVSVVE